MSAGPRPEGGAPRTVLVTGAGGQLGLDVLDAFVADDVIGLGHDDLDVADRGAVLAAVRRHHPDVVVHCAAWTNVDGCEQEPDRAHRVNALGSWWVAQGCAEVGARLVAISTDYVFNGADIVVGDDPDAVRPWTEFDAVDPISEYGRSKAAGEELIRRTLDRHHIVRTAWVCGARGNNFVRTMLRVGREQGAATVVDDQWGSPTFTRDLAAAVHELADSDLFGTWNRTSTGRTNWHDFAAAVFEEADVDVDLGRMDSSQLDRPAPRPPWSVLSHQHADAAGLTPMPHWRDSLRALLAELRDLEAATAGATGNGAGQ